MTKVLDSSILFEYLYEGKFAELFSQSVYVSTVSFFEVEKALLKKGASTISVSQTVVFLQSLLLFVDVDTRIAHQAVALSIKHDLAMADAIILATSQSLQLPLYTKDNDFRGIKNVVMVSE